MTEDDLIAEQNYAAHLRSEQPVPQRGNPAFVPITPPAFGLRKTKVICSHKVTYYEDPRAGDRDSLIAWQVWPCCDALMTYAEHIEPELLRGKSVLELGSGVGLLGVAACLLGARSVLLTDIPKALPLLRYNVFEENAVHVTGKNVRVEALEWGSDKACIKHILPDKVDIIVCTDVVYDACAFLPLVKTLIDVTDYFAENHDSVPLVLVAYEKREMYPAQMFFEEMLKYFDRKVLFQGWGSMRSDLNMDTVDDTDVFRF
ncbi:hypothetical protein CYMTET_26425 [Cymbomonas tetramitiformis]|uniref:Uncharacterized protein n=1 Tax=Cymbomonas tetramitiformis TaxID=36881 RepID=A0AAE0KY89_9CHLO|nr:hypothetical protein CYMTET_26425 [Cymbomonas tetramitiformis]